MIITDFTDSVGVEQAQNIRHDGERMVIPSSKLNLRNSKDKRITILGHGGAEAFSIFGQDKLTPEQLATELITRGLKKNEKITVDLIACGVGLIAVGQDSYAIRLAKALFKSGYDNVQVNALNNLGAEQVMAGAIYAYYTSEVFRRDSIYYGFTAQNWTQYQADEKKLEAEIASKGLTQVQKHQKYTDGLIKLNEKYGTVIIKTIDIRFVLDNNENYQITKGSLEKLLQLSPPSIHAIILINKRIYELKEDSKKWHLPNRDDVIKKLGQLKNDIYEKKIGLSELLTVALKDEILKKDSKAMGIFKKLQAMVTWTLLKEAKHPKPAAQETAPPSHANANPDDKATVNSNQPSASVATSVIPNTPKK